VANSAANRPACFFQDREHSAAMKGGRKPLANRASHKRIFFSSRRRGRIQGAVSNEESWAGYTEDEVERVREIIECYDLRTIGSVVACLREFQDNYITVNVIANMCRDGHFGREGDQIFLLDEAAE
jgi:hypothetical protein